MVGVIYLHECIWVNLFWTLYGYNLEASLWLYGPKLQSQLKGFGDFTPNLPRGIFYISDEIKQRF